MFHVAVSPYRTGGPICFCKHMYSGQCLVQNLIPYHTTTHKSQHRPLIHRNPRIFRLLQPLLLLLKASFAHLHFPHHSECCCQSRHTQDTTTHLGQECSVDDGTGSAQFRDWATNFHESVDLFILSVARGVHETFLAIDASIELVESEDDGHAGNSGSDVRSCGWELW